MVAIASEHATHLEDEACGCCCGTPLSLPVLGFRLGGPAVDAATTASPASRRSTQQAQTAAEEPRPSSSQCPRSELGLSTGADSEMSFSVERPAVLVKALGSEVSPQPCELAKATVARYSQLVSKSTTSTVWEGVGKAQLLRCSSALVASSTSSLLPLPPPPPATRHQLELPRRCRQTRLLSTSGTASASVQETRNTPLRGVVTQGAAAAEGLENGTGTPMHADWLGGESRPHHCLFLYLTQASYQRPCCKPITSASV